MAQDRNTAKRAAKAGAKGGNKKSGKQQAPGARRGAKHKKAGIKLAAVIAVLALVCLGIAGAFNGGNSTTTTMTTAAPTTTTAKAIAGSAIKGTTPCPAADGSSPRAASFAKAPPMCIDSSKKYTATFDTSEGTVVVALDTTKTPNTVNNFVVLALYHYYDGTQIFRTDPSIDIIQGGAPNTESASDPGPGYTINDEGSGYTYSPGDLVMARTSGANSAGAQFFFVTGSAASQLNGQGTYVTFGHASSGLDVLQKIIGLSVATDDGLGGAPSHTVTIKSVKITAS